MFKKIFTNTFAQILGKIITSALAFFSTLILARMLGGNGFGEFTKVVAFVSLFYIISDFGLNTLYLKETHEDIETHFASFLGLRFFWSLLLMVLAVGIMWSLTIVNVGFSSLVRAGTFIASANILFYGLITTFSLVFQKNLRYKYVSLAQIAGSICNFLILVFLLFNPYSLTGDRLVRLSLLAIVVGSAVTLMIEYAISRRYIQKFGKFVNFDFWKKILRLGLPLGLVLTFNIIYFHIDSLILSAYRPSLEVGVYGLAYKFFEFCLTLPTFLLNSAYPLLLINKNDFPKLKKQISQIFILLFGASLLIVSVGWFLAPLIVLVKSDFQNSIFLFRILLLSLPVFYLSSPLMWVYVIFNNQKRLIWVYGASMLINIIANLIFIPVYGAVAAAVITGISELVVLLLGIILLKVKNNK